MQCFGTRNATKYQGTDLSETWRAWTFQVCTTWGYFIIAPNDPKQPRIISSLKTLESTSRICRQVNENIIFLDLELIIDHRHFPRANILPFQIGQM